jgi:hypothetical protein
MTTTAPMRAFRLTLKLDADTREGMAGALRSLADQVDRNELTVGCYGSPSDGAIYELLSDPAMTHERYFAEMHAYLDAQRAGGGA